MCSIEPDFPCRFAHQFGYDQLYVGNPSMKLKVHGDLINGAWAWFWSVTGCTNAKFSLPVAEPQLQVTFLCYNWLIAANAPTKKKRISELEAEKKKELEPIAEAFPEAEPSRKGKQVAGSEESEEEPFTDIAWTSEEEAEAGDKGIDTGGDEEEDITYFPPTRF